MSQIICCNIEYLTFAEAPYSYFGQVYIDRDPMLMALLGGGPRAGEVDPLFDLRGFPGDANLWTNMAWYLLVSERESSLRRTVPRAQAEQWVRNGDAQWVGRDSITDPDYFGPSWLESRDLGQVYGAYRERQGAELATVEAVLGAMEALPGSRLVYWFGN